jgi:tetratricopeptide (TPR) repeat protein
MTRLATLLLLGCLGCQGVLTQNAQSEPETELRIAAPEPKRPGAGNSPVTAVAHSADLHLIQAAALLDKGRETEAAVQLEKYLNHRPDQLLVRAQLGELLFRMRKLDDARQHFETFIALAQEQGEKSFRYLVHCHSRMVEIAEDRNDDYEEHLHRGIGLYLLACRRATEPDPEGEYSVSSILCRAAGELQEARKEQPDQARPHLYLYRVWSRLGQAGAANKALAAADHHALLSELTPHERQELQIAFLRESQAVRSTKIR